MSNVEYQAGSARTRNPAPARPETLHPTLWLGHQLARHADVAVPSGFTALDAQLPGGGWPRRALTEPLLPDPGVGEIRLLGASLVAAAPAARAAAPPAARSAQRRRAGFRAARTQRRAAPHLGAIAPGLAAGGCRCARGARAQAPWPTALGATLLARIHRQIYCADLAAMHAALDPLAAWLIGPDRDQGDALEGMGLRTPAELRCLPRSGLARRFGPAVLSELDRAYGACPDPLEPIALPPAFDSRLELFARADTTEQVLYGASVLLALCLCAQHAFVRRFSLLMQHEPRWRRDAQTPTGGGRPSARTCHAARRPGCAAALERAADRRVAAHTEPRHAGAQCGSTARVCRRRRHCRKRGFCKGDSGKTRATKHLKPA